jgi:terminase, large subunit
MRWIEWALANVVTDTGRPYDSQFYPQIGAPGGPADSFDDHKVRLIALQWGVRLGKTFFGSCCLLNAAQQNPSPMMLASSREKLAIDVTGRLYEMLRRGPLSTLLAQPEHLQKRDLIEFEAARCYVAWARSPSSLADKNVRVGHANEIDKWEQATTSTEGDPLDLFLDRFNDFLSSRKVIVEGTPSVKHRSRIERLRLQGTNCSAYVPCRRCLRYQILELGGLDTPHGIKWDTGPDGRSDPDLAGTTARYVCRHCREGLPSEDRPWMLRRMVWVPEGCGVDDQSALVVSTMTTPPPWKGWKFAEWVTGTPARDGEEATYYLPSLYAQAIPSWGEFAKRFLKVKNRPQSLRAFVNQWLAKTWESTERRHTWEQVGQRVISPDLAPGIIPAAAVIVTAGVDKQLDHYVYVINAWDHIERPHTIAYGNCKTLEELDQLVLQRSFPQQQGTAQGVRFALMDSGYRPKQVYAFCRARKRRRRIQPAKGANSKLDTYVRRHKLGEATSSPGQPIVLVDSSSTQDWMDEMLAPVPTGSPAVYTLFAGSLADHQDFLEQLLNDGPAGDIGPDGNYRERWEKIDPGIPNDYRDAMRYSYGALKLYTRGASMIPRNVPQSAQSQPAPGPVKLTEF